MATEQDTHRAYVKMRNDQEKAARNPYFSDYKEKAKDSEMEYLKAQLEEEKSKNQRSSW